MGVTKFFCCYLSVAVMGSMMGLGTALAAQGISDPLKVHEGNPRYFADSVGKAVYLTGSHVWDNFLDWGGNKPDFDYASYLELLRKNNHNFIRLWVGTPRVFPDGARFRTKPMPWKRTGPDKAKDGELKFDLTKLEEEYFSRLRSRVAEAERKGIYVSLMLFNGLFNWEGHPFNINNNINNINAETEKDMGGDSIYSLRNPTILRIQEDYVKKVIDTVNDLDNVLYEIGNEIKGHSIEWQYHMINFIQGYQKTKPKQHPIGMTGGGEGMRNKDLLNSPADWISPTTEPGQNYSHNPPPSDGKKVTISDTDHLAGVLENPTKGWVWKSFLRGLNPVLMDVLQNTSPGYDKEWNHPNRPGFGETRVAMGQTLRFARRVNLSKMVPSLELASTGYCLANPGVEYLVYFPFDDLRKREKILQRVRIGDNKISVDLSGVSGSFCIEWFNPKTGDAIEKGTTTGGGIRFFKAPFAGDAVLYLHR